MAPAVAAEPNVIWDGRFRLAGRPPDAAEQGILLGALGQEAIRFRNRTGPPALILQGLPALRQDGELLAVPHIGIGDPRWRVLFDPGNCAAGAPFVSG